MKRRLVRCVGMVPTDGTGAPCATAGRSTPIAGRAANVVDAGRHIEPTRRQGAHRTACQARFVSAAVARIRRRCGGRPQGMAPWERQCAAVGMPKPIVRVDQDTDRRCVNGIGAFGPALERQIRRSTEREQGGCTKRPRGRGDHGLGPVVERLTRRLLCLIRMPHRGAGVADEDQRPRGGAPGAPGT